MMRLSRVLIYALLVSTVGTAVLLTIGAAGGLGPSMARASTSGLTLVMALGVAVCCAIVLERQVAPRLMLSGLIADAVAAVSFLVLHWFDLWYQYPQSQRIMIWPTVWAVSMALLGLLLLPRSPGKWWAVLRRVTIVLLCLFAAQIALAVAFAPMPSTTNYVRAQQYADVATRFGIALGVLFLGAYATTWLTLWMVPTPVTTERKPFSMTCPRCSTEQSLLTGEARCATCGLGIKVSTL